MNLIDNFKITIQTFQDRLTHTSLIDQTSPPGFLLLAAGTEEVSG